jgi:hypothetical protein
MVGPYLDRRRVGHAREKTAKRWVKLVRNSPFCLGHPGENPWVMIVRNDTNSRTLREDHRGWCVRYPLIDALESSLRSTTPG